MVLSMERWKGKVAIVTGASSGIGESIAEILVEEGLQVVGLARRVEKVEENSKKLMEKTGKLHAVRCDITKEEDIVKAFEWVKTNLGPVHILVNNAGLANKNTLIGGDAEKWRQIFDTNVIGLCIATREGVESMKQNNVDGHIIHINSICGHIVANFPTNVYTPSKFAVTALTEVLRNELNGIDSKIKITSISPGAVKSEIWAHSDISHLMLTIPILESRDVAEAVLYVLSTPPHVQVHELIIKPVGEKM